MGKVLNSLKNLIGNSAQIPEEDVDSTDSDLDDG